MPTAARLLPLAALALLCGACRHSVPRVPPDYTQWVLINYPAPPEPVIPHEDDAVDRLVDGFRTPILGPAEPRPQPVQIAIPAGVRTASGGIYVDVWVVGKDADELAKAMSGGLNLGTIRPSRLFRIRVNGAEIELAEPTIETGDFVRGFWLAPPFISARSLAPEQYTPDRRDSPTRVLQPFMLRCGPIEAETCEVTVLGPTQTREMDRPVQGSTAVVPVRSSR